MKRKVTGVVIALTMCLNSMPTTVMAESEAPQGSDVKAVSESGGKTEEKGTEESAATEEAEGENSENGKEDAKEESNPTEENSDTEKDSSDENNREETKAEEGEQEEKEPTEEKGEENNAEEKKEEVKDSETPSVEENKSEEVKQEEEKQPAQEAVTLTAENGTAVQATGEAVAKIGEDEYETLDEAIEATLAEDSATISLLKNAVLSSEAITYCPLVIEMNGFSITGNIRAGDDLTLKDGTVEGNVTVDASTEQGKFVMTAPSEAEAAIKGSLIVNIGCSANIGGAKVGVSGDSVQIDTEEEVIILGTEKAVKLKSAVTGSSKTIYGSTTTDGDVSQAEFSDGTYKIGDEVAKKITNVSNGQVTPPTKYSISFEAASESKDVVAGNSVTFTVKYDGINDLKVDVQKNANVNIATKIENNNDNTYTVTITPNEDVAAGAYKVFVSEINNSEVNAEATLNITEAGAKLTIGDTTTYYATLAEILTDTQLAGGSVVTVLKDESDAYVSHYIYTEETGITLDLNGKRLGSNLYVGKVANSNGNRGKVTIIDSVGNGSCTIYVGTNGTLIFAPESSGTIGYIFSGGGDITLSGGQVVISNIDSTNKPITDFLADGYAYKDEKGNYIEYATAKKLYMSNSQYHVFYVVQCDHNDINTDTVVCKFCNKTLDTAIEWKSGNTTKYFSDLKTALSDSDVKSSTANTRGTLKILNSHPSPSPVIDADQLSGISSGNYDFDLNGIARMGGTFNITGGSVKIINTYNRVYVGFENLKIKNADVKLGGDIYFMNIETDKPLKDLLNDGMTMQILNSRYLTESELNSNSIQKVIIVEAPLTITTEPTDAQLNSIVYKGNSGTVPFVFSRNDWSDNEITVTYKIDGDNEITKTVTDNEIDLLSELNQLSVGNHTLVLSATYNGYTTLSKTYNFKVSKSTPTIRWNGYPYGKFYTGSKIANPLENDDITIENGGSYSDIEFKWYTKAGKELADNPVNAGDYIIKAVFAETPNTNAATYQCNITIGKKPVATENGKTIDGDVDVYITSAEQTYEVDLKDVLNSVEGVLADDNFTLNTNYGGVKYYGQVKSAVMENGKVKISMPSLEQIKNPTDGIGLVNVALSSTNYGYIPLSLNVNAINKQEETIDSNYITMDSWTYGEDPKEPKLSVMTEGSIPSTYAVSYAKKDGIALNGVPTDAGEYTVTISYETKDCIYKGTKDFTIKRKSIEGATVTLDNNSFVYDGEVKEPKVTSVVLGEVTLTAGTDYGSECEQKIDVGTYTLKVVANDGNYTGEIAVQWSITAKDMAAADATVAGGNVYTGKIIEPEITIKDGSKELVKGTDYDVEYSNNINAGTGNADITFKGNYSGSTKKTFEIARKKVAADIEFTKTFTYTGSEIKPTVVLKDGNTTIPESEYNVFYESNTNAGTGKIIVTDNNGGNYEVNRIEETFTINKADGEATAPTAIENIVYNGKEQVLINAGSSSTGEMQYKVGENGTYVAELPKAVNAGEYTVFYKSVGDNNHEDTAEGSITVSISPKDIAGAKVTLDYDSFVYDGTVKAPEVTSVVLDGSELTIGTDCGYSCVTHIDVGTYELNVASNKGNFIGKITVPWSITAKDMAAADATVAGGNVYTGKIIEPEITIKDGSKELVKGTDYDVEYSNNINAGTGNADITFKGNYSGSTKKTFEIARKKVAADIEFTKTFTYTGSEIKPTVVLKDGNTTIPESEYNVFYESNTNAGTGKIIVTDNNGGNYEVNRIEETFTINKAEGEATAPTAIENIVYSGNEQILINAGSSSTGEMQYKIGENGTYASELPKAVNAGEYTVFYKSVGDNNHEDTAEGSITVSIAPKNIKGAEVTLNHDSLVYNGEEQLPEVTSVVLDGVTLTQGINDDYRYNGDKKIDVGTYTLTVIANDINYTGTVEVPWSITPKIVTANIEVTGTYTYTGSAIEPTIVVKDGETVIPENEYNVSYESNTNAGTGKVIVTDNDGGNYTVNGEKEFTINKAEGEIVAPTAIENIVYNGKEQVLINAGSSSTGEIHYYIDGDGTSTTKLPKAVNAGEYTVYYMVIGDSNHENVERNSITVNIEKAEVTIKALDKDRRRGNGMLDIPATLAEGEDYTVSGLIGDDKLGGTISISFAETEDKSKYDINITAEGINENYKPVYEKGTLNIHNKSTGESDPSYTGDTSTGGGSSSSSKNDVTVDDKAENGTIKIDKDTASKGSTVTITVTPDEGYEVDEIKVTDESGNEIEVTDKGNGKYTFTMPSTDVDIKADFKETTSDSEETEKTIITMQIGNTDVSVNEDVITNDVAPVIRNDRTLVPIRVVTETLGGKVDWNAKTKEVTLNIDGKEIKMTIGKTLEKYGVAPMIINDRTYVPIRFVAEELGAEVQWNEETKTVTIIKTATEK